jgi:glutaminyl-peptide cyclotransferase
MLRLCIVLGFLILLSVLGYSLTSGPTAFSGDAAFAILTTLTGFGPRLHGSPGAGLAMRYFDERASHLHCAHKWLRFDPPEKPGKTGGEFASFLLSFRPKAKERLLLASHWDTPVRADGAKVPTQAPVPGANDGGSGVAVLLQLAEQLDPAADALPFGVDLLLFDGEEQGSRLHPEGYCAGSRWLADDMEGRLGHRPAGVIVIDMVGDSDLNIYMEKNSLAGAPRWTRGIFDTAAALGLSGFKATPKWTIEDDHSPFLAQRVPACLLIDFDYPHWHTPADTLDKCSAGSLGQVGSLLLALCRDTGLLHRTK